MLVDYKYDDVDPEFTGEDLYSQDFETVEKDKDIVLEGWEQVTLKGDKNGRERSIAIMVMHNSRPTILRVKWILGSFLRQ